MELGVGWGEPQANPNRGIEEAPVGVRLRLTPTYATLRTYSPIVSSDALPPAAVVLMVSVRSPAKRNR